MFKTLILKSSNKISTHNIKIYITFKQSIYIFSLPVQFFPYSNKTKIDSKSQKYGFFNENFML